MAGDSNYWTSVYRRRLSRRALLRSGAIGVTGLGAAVVLGCGEDEAGPAATPTGAASPVTTATGTPTVVHPDQARGWPFIAAKTPDQSPPVPSWSKRYPEASQLLVKHHYTTLPLETKPRRGGVFHTSGSQKHFDIFREPGVTAVWALASPVFSNLTKIRFGLHSEDFFSRINQYSFSVTGDAAASMEQPDSTTFIFKLYPDIYYHDISPVNGRTMTAEDIVYSMGRYAGPESPLRYVFEDTNSIEAVDKLTVRIKQKRATPYFLLSISSNTFEMASPEWAEMQGPDRQPIGSGAWMVKQFDQGVKVVYQRHPKFVYRKDGNSESLPYMDGAIAFQATDPTSILAQFRAGNIDNINFSGVGEYQSLVESMGGINKVVAQVGSGVTSTGSHIDYVVTKPPYNDIRVRRALNLALDIQVVIDDVYQGGACRTDVLPWNFMGRDWPPALKDYGPWQQYNPEQAKQLLKEAGFEGGFKLKLTAAQAALTGVGGSAISLIEAMWKQIGVTLERDSIDAAKKNQIDDNSIKYETDAVWSLLLSNDRDPQGFLYGPRHSKGPRNFQGIADPKLDGMIEKQAGELNPEQRVLQFRQIFEYYNDQAYNWWGPNSFFFTTMQPWLRGWAAHLTNTGNGSQWRAVSHTAEAPKRSL